MEPTPTSDQIETWLEVAPGGSRACPVLGAAGSGCTRCLMLAVIGLASLGTGLALLRAAEPLVLAAGCALLVAALCLTASALFAAPLGRLTASAEGLSFRAARSFGTESWRWDEIVGVVRQADSATIRLPHRELRLPRPAADPIVRAAEMVWGTRLRAERAAIDSHRDVPDGALSRLDGSEPRAEVGLSRVDS